MFRTRRFIFRKTVAYTVTVQCVYTVTVQCVYTVTVRCVYTVTVQCVYTVTVQWVTDYTDACKTYHNCQYNHLPEDEPSGSEHIEVKKKK
jgi:hypothetical protein